MFRSDQLKINYVNKLKFDKIEERFKIIFLSFFNCFLELFSQISFINSMGFDDNTKIQ